MPPLKTIGLVSLGCAKNAVDLQVMAGYLRKAGFVLAPNPDDADVLLVNTCAFIEQAREEAVSELLRACELKKSGRCRAVIAAGCFVQRFRDSLAETFPDIDAFLGIDALDKIADVVRGIAAARSRRAVRVPGGSPHRVFSPPEPALRFTGQAFAYLKIAEGCAHRCSYCAIPAIRGSFRSRRMADILAEAKALVATGVRELNVVAQDPMLYGVDLGPARGRRTVIVDLLEAIDGLDGDFRVLVLYSYQSEITDAFLGWMARSPRALRYVDVPLQHTVPSVLKAMARGGAVEATRTVADRIRAAVPGVTLRTTVMTGFPGETEDDFRRMLADIRRMKFDHLGAFAFSPEEGTVAAELDRQVPTGVAERRRQEVMRAQKSIWRTKAKSFVGQTLPALVVAPGIARLESQAPDVDGVTYLSAAGKRRKVAVGDVMDVRIDAVKGYDFEGTPMP